MCFLRVSITNSAKKEEVVHNSWNDLFLDLHIHLPVRSQAMVAPLKTPDVPPSCN